MTAIAVGELHRLSKHFENQKCADEAPRFQISEIHRTLQDDPGLQGLSAESIHFRDQIPGYRPAADLCFGIVVNIKC